ncbi:hypothetical protein QAD02_005046 [Eretmocerus hayati]|uniref:Uncharacterized protein n=1 Tax=Eretmocerus hayati TaxID=131215 RepID=A0ACC2NRQ4_9HYME|nr:hypothetical protein QAD02_005046 [Eretmocerus hayati]
MTKIFPLESLETRFATRAHKHGYVLPPLHDQLIDEDVNSDDNYDNDQSEELDDIEDQVNHTGETEQPIMAVADPAMRIRRIAPPDFILSGVLEEAPSQPAEHTLPSQELNYEQNSIQQPPPNYQEDNCAGSKSRMESVANPVVQKKPPTNQSKLSVDHGESESYSAKEETNHHLNEPNKGIGQGSVKSTRSMRMRTGKSVEIDAIKLIPTKTCEAPHEKLCEYPNRRKKVQEL